MSESRKSLKPRNYLPTLDDSDNGAWWRGYYASAPLWFTLGFALAVIFLKK